jgi:hypothetical protein
MLKKILSLIAIQFLLNGSIFAQNKVVYIYPGSAPGTESWNWEEGMDLNNSWKTQVAYNVTKPSLTVFTPEASVANGTAVVICPGGGFIALALGNEGMDVANWLVKKGVTCFVLKYRLAHVNNNDPVKYFNDAVHAGDKEKIKQQQEAIPLGIADGKAAIAYVRAHWDYRLLCWRNIGCICSFQLYCRKQTQFCGTDLCLFSKIDARNGSY